MLGTSHDTQDVPELTDRLVVLAEGVRRTREATTDDMQAMVILGESDNLMPAANALWSR